ncbi:hypothetical protein AKO1_006498 [Acrasis kona]|uniref:Developmentally-regulated protein n=1 Tax=Acrasis kona TaxID=1008807 RepID=A0AAW2YYA1_9EUKA
MNVSSLKVLINNEIYHIQSGEHSTFTYPESNEADNTTPLSTSKIWWSSTFTGGVLLPNQLFQKMRQVSPSCSKIGNEFFGVKGHCETIYITVTEVDGTKLNIPSLIHGYESSENEVFVGTFFTKHTMYIKSPYLSGDLSVLYCGSSHLVHPGQLKVLNDPNYCFELEIEAQTINSDSLMRRFAIIYQSIQKIELISDSIIDDARELVVMNHFVPLTREERCEVMLQSVRTLARLVNPKTIFDAHYVMKNIIDMSIMTDGQQAQYNNLRGVIEGCDNLLKNKMY